MANIPSTTKTAFKEVSSGDGRSDHQETKLRLHDILDIESNTVGHGSSKAAGAAAGSWTEVLYLAFMSLGVIYGDMGTSPMYVYASTFPNGIIKDKNDILGVLSLIYYTLTVLPLVKYVFIVLKANDDGKGGTFALYSLFCRHADVGLLPRNEDDADEDELVVNDQLTSNHSGLSLKFKNFLEKSIVSKYAMLIVTMLSTSLVISDGVLTPAISVLSAVGGLKAASPSVFTEGRVVWISVAILILLFSVQRFGTEKVGYGFAPIVSVWFMMNAGIGLYNFIKYDPTVIKAVNPWHIIQYFIRNGKEAWISLGGVVLCVTGTEALFADVGDFSVKSIQISMSAVVYPALLLTYSGQASYLRLHQDDVTNAFYNSIPVLAAIIASQAMISGTFSIIQQSLALGCFPRVSVVHTSDKFEGQVYIPEVNYVIMTASVIVTLAFRTTEKIGNAYGIAVVFAEAITSSFMILVMLVIWKTNVFTVIAYVCCIMSVEFVYLTSVLYKFPHGGYFPIAFACLLLAVMFIWNYVYRKKYYYEVENKVSPETLRDITSQSNFCRIPGLAIFYSELVHGIPPIFEHYVGNVPALQSVVVSTVPAEEQFLFRRVKLRELYVFRCVGRYGYTDARNDDGPFETLLVERLKEFMRDDFWIHASKNQIERRPVDIVEVVEEEPENNYIDNGESDEQSVKANEKELEKEIGVVDKASRVGIVHLMGESEVSSSK